MRSSLLAVFLTTLLPILVSAQERLEYIIHPDPYPNEEFHSAAGLAMSALPRTVVEEEVRTIPMLDFQCRYGLPANFSLYGRASSNVLTNYAKVAPQWSFQEGRFSLGVNYGLAFWYGIANFDGFDVTASSWLNIPTVSLGVDFDDWLLTFSGDMQIVTSVTTKIEQEVVGTNKNYVAGYGIGVTIEQPFYQNTHSLVSVKLNYSQAIYQAWLAFSTFKQYFFYSEFSFSLLF
jgi:hypothetical protein